jgi:hypothetical protein
MAWLESWALQSSSFCGSAVGFLPLASTFLPEQSSKACYAMLCSAVLCCAVLSCGGLMLTVVEPVCMPFFWIQERLLAR